MNPQYPTGIKSARTEPSRCAAEAGNFLTIQALRAIAALMVVAYHAFDMWAFRIKPQTSNLWVNGAAGVDIFFVLSGFVMVISSRRFLTQPGGWNVFLRHRVARIVPLYWLLTTLKLVAVLLFAGLALRSSLDPSTIVRSYLFLPVVDSAGHFRPLLPIGWTLSYEFLFYGLFALALAIRVDVLRVLVPAFVAFIALALLRTASWPTWTILFHTIVLEFVFGVCLAKLTLRRWLLPHAVAACILILGFALIMIMPKVSAHLRPLTWGLPALAIVAGAVSLEMRLGHLLPKWLLQLGDASYSIYLVHGFALPIIGLGIMALHWTGPTALALTVAACLVIGTVSGWLVYILIERPMTLWMKRHFVNEKRPAFHGTPHNALTLNDATSGTLIRR